MNVSRGTCPVCGSTEQGELEGGALYCLGCHVMFDPDALLTTMELFGMTVYVDPDLPPGIVAYHTPDPVASVPADFPSYDEVTKLYWLKNHVRGYALVGAGTTEEMLGR